MRVEIPGYSEALADEAAVRELSYVDAPRTVAGIDVRQPTILDVVLLTHAESPFLVGGQITPGAIAQWFWHMATPEYRKRGRVWHILTMRRLKYDETLREIQEFLDRHLQDSPAGSESTQAEFVSWVAAAVHALASAYGWTERDILNMPLARVFQYLRLIQRNLDPNALFINRSDRVRGVWLKSQQPQQTP